MTTPALTDRETIAGNIVKFTQDNGLLIHPGQDPFKWADLVIKKGGCPCVPGRSCCPCEFVLEDVKELGRCRCGLFCNDAYLKEYNALNNARKSKKRWTRKPRVSS
ncbi:hypothetical protein ES703_73067 [subsurface metagenome]